MRPTAILAKERPSRLVALPEVLARSGLDVWLTPPLYHLSDQSPIWADLGRLQRPLLFVQTIYPRAMEALARRHGVWRDDSRALDARAWESAEGLVAGLPEAWKAVGEGVLRMVEGVAGVRWYPLMDEARCTHCGACHQFCLFGVYELDERGNVCIAHPDQCKPGCPACSRICPEGALIFPLYARDAAIAGAPGQFPKPDAAARKMYYARTGATCPACGCSGRPVTKPDVAVCEECGRACIGAQIRDELDALLDGLDRLQGGRN